MSNEQSIGMPTDPARQTGEISVRLGQHVRLETRLDLTPRGILAIGGLVSSILLSTAVLVAVAVRESR